ncbi:hypothetical protein IMZ48_38135, partial [Candidatus Bathyarchaeota archaeon]|nr:hypothetical protein [Candidatus Bathyarchaeota archaeon]
MDIHHIDSRSELASTSDLAQQVVDVVTLRPEVKLCYVGLLKDCFEILEADPSSRMGDVGASALDTNAPTGSNVPSATGDDDETASDGSSSEEDESAGGGVHGAVGAPGSQSGSESPWASDGEELGDMGFE